MSTCARCGATFSCGMVDNKASETCWCMQLPPLPLHLRSTENPDAVSCMCPDCLRHLLTASTVDQRETSRQR